MEADVVSHKSNVKQLYFSKHKTQALFRLCFVTLYILIYNLKVSSNFHLTFLQYNVIIMFTVQEKLFFILLLGIFFELPITRTPDNSNFFRFPLKVWVIGSRLYLNGSLSRQEPPNLQSNLWLTSWTFLCFFKLYFCSYIFHACSVYFLRVDHICSMVSHHELIDYAANAWRTCLQYLFPSRSARLTVLLIIV